MYGYAMHNVEQYGPERGGVVTAITSAAAASAAVSTATQRLNRGSALRVAVRSPWFEVRADGGTFNQLYRATLVGDEARRHGRIALSADIRVRHAVDHGTGRSSATISQRTLPVAKNTTTPTMAATITRIATAQSN